MDFLKRKKVPFQVIDVTKTPPTASQLREICRKLGVGPRDLLRKKDAAYGELGLESARHTDDQLYELMARNPGLIQRPIVVKGARAVVARPPEAAADLLE